MILIGRKIKTTVGVDKSENVKKNDKYLWILEADTVNLVYYDEEV